MLGTDAETIDFTPAIRYIVALFAPEEDVLLENLSSEDLKRVPVGNGELGIGGAIEGGLLTMTIIGFIQSYFQESGKELAKATWVYLKEAIQRRETFRSDLRAYLLAERIDGDQADQIIEKLNRALHEEIANQQGKQNG